MRFVSEPPGLPPIKKLSRAMTSRLRGIGSFAGQKSFIRWPAGEPRPRYDKNLMRKMKMVPLRVGCWLITIRAPQMPPGNDGTKSHMTYSSGGHQGSRKRRARILNSPPAKRSGGSAIADRPQHGS